jgi:hypothetical protein
MSHASEPQTPDRKDAPAAPRSVSAQPVDRGRPMATIAYFHRKIAVNRPTVDDHTWDDLALDDVFARLDHTQTMPGAQVLYHHLRTYEQDDAVLAERTRQHQFFRSDGTARERLKQPLARLGSGDADQITPLLFNGPPDAPEFAWLLQVLSILTPLSILAIFLVHPLFLILALALMATNAGIYATYGQKIAPHFTGFWQIDRLLAVAKEIGETRTTEPLPQLTQLREKTPVITLIRRRFGWLVIDRTAQPDLMQSLYGYLNMLFLFDVVIFLRSIRVLRDHQRDLLAIFEAVGSLDASLAVASYLDGGVETTVPQRTSDRRIDASGLFHPLIPAPVANDFQLSGRSALVAGPNMAGKTAFIRTVGLNVILAQTLHFCHARRATLPRAIVRSAIRREDKLSEGSSYFFTEIKQMLDFSQTPAEPLHLFLIDEIFRGTNTTERIASSAAVLRHLAQHHFVFATTHDLELQELLAGNFAMYHFRDRVTEGNMASTISSITGA